MLRVIKTLPWLCCSAVRAHVENQGKGDARSCMKARVKRWEGYAGGAAVDDQDGWFLLVPNTLAEAGVFWSSTQVVSCLHRKGAACASGPAIGVNKHIVGEVSEAKVKQRLRSIRLGVLAHVSRCKAVAVGSGDASSLGLSPAANSVSPLVSR